MYKSCLPKVSIYPQQKPESCKVGLVSYRCAHMVKGGPGVTGVK